MYALAHTIMAEDVGASAPVITFHPTFDAAEAALRKIEGLEVFDNNEHLDVEFKEVDGQCRYRFINTGPLHDIEEHLYAVATIAQVIV